jgi:hypothetical protein
MNYYIPFNESRMMIKTHDNRIVTTPKRFGYLYCVKDILLYSLLQNPAIIEPRILEVKSERKPIECDGLRCKSRQLFFVKFRKLPFIPLRKRIEIAIHLAIINGYNNSNWITWALHYTDKTDHLISKKSSRGGVNHGAWTMIHSNFEGIPATILEAARWESIGDLGGGLASNYAFAAISNSLSINKKYKDFNFLKLLHEIVGF